MLNDNLKSDKTADEKCNKSADKSVNSETSENRNDITMVQKVPETSGKKYPKKDAISPAEEHAVVKRNEAEKKHSDRLSFRIRFILPLRRGYVYG